MKPYRKERITSLIQRIVSGAIEHKLNDPRVAPLTTVSRVQMTGDLTIATVYLTIPEIAPPHPPAPPGAGGADAIPRAGGSAPVDRSPAAMDTVEELTLRAIRHARGYLQRMVAQELTIRQCPELRFELDEAAKRARHTMRLIEENRRNRGEDPALDEPGATEADDPEKPGSSPNARSDRPAPGNAGVEPAGPAGEGRVRPAGDTDSPPQSAGSKRSSPGTAPGRDGGDDA